MPTDQKLGMTLSQVEGFLVSHYDTPMTNIQSLTGGQWSQAFRYEVDGQKYVARFGNHQDDYLKDKYISQFGSDNLPIPKVMEVGEVTTGYYALSEYAEGTMIDDLDKDGMRRLVPSLLTTMDAIREVDVSATQGFGPLGTDGNGKFVSWQEFLLDVKNEESGSRIQGWKEGLAGSPIGIQPFEEGYEALVAICDELPPVRSLIHNDLINFNVLANEDKVTAVIDWGNAMYGDFLYDLANFVIWAPIHEPVKGIDWQAEAIAHYEAIGLEIPDFEKRLKACMLHHGLGSLSYYGFTKDWTHLEPIAKRTLDIARG